MKSSIGLVESKSTNGRLRLSTNSTVSKLRLIPELRQNKKSNYHCKETEDELSVVELASMHVDLEKQEMTRECKCVN